MGKFEECYDICEGLYVNDGHTLTQIKAETEVSLTTLTKWKNDGDWEAKRKERTKADQGLKSLLSQITNKLASEILKKLKTGEVDSQALYALARLAGITVSGKLTDEQEEADAPKQKGLSPELAKQIRDQILGISDKDDQASR